MLKVYLSVPMVANRALDRANLMAKAIRDSGNQVASPWVLGALENPDRSVTNIFQRDKGGVEESDAIVADVTEPSIGVGMELMAAYNSGKRIVIVARKGRVTSRMLDHMDRKEILEYEAESEIYQGLMRVLREP